MNILFIVPLLLLCKTHATEPSQYESLSFSPTFLSMVQQLASVVAYKNTPSSRIHPLLNSMDFVTLSEKGTIHQGDCILLNATPDLRTPRSYMYYGVSMSHLLLTPFPNTSGRYVYEVGTEKELYIYSQYQDVQNGIMLPPTNTFSRLHIIPRESAYEGIFQEN